MVRLLVLAAIVSLVAMPQVRPAPTVLGASALVESRDSPTLIVRFTNLSDVGLQTLELEVQSAAGVVRRSWSARTAPLGTGGTGEVAIGPLASEPPLPVKITVAVFADGTVFGEPAEVARVQTVSIAIADDLSAWREILSPMSNIRHAEGMRVLRAAIERRKAAQATDPSGMRRQVELWLREDRAPGFFSSVATGWLKTIDTRLAGIGPLARAARLPRGTQPQDHLIERISAVTTTGVTRHFAVSVRNDRDVPLESWAVVLSDAETGRPLRVIGRDTANELGSSAAAAGVPGGGILEVGTYQPEADLAGGLRAHLEFAMWHDLAWQGYDAIRQGRFANREMRAEEYEFFVSALREAANLPPGQALGLLKARQGEFRAGPLGRQSSGLQVQLKEWERLVATAPHVLPDRLNAHAAALERAIPSLLRHRQK